MRPKACAKCRQWKVRCDLAEGHPDGCSRCRSQKVTCVFDARFKRISKSVSIRSMSSEIQQLRQALQESASNPSSSNEIRQSNNSVTAPLDWTLNISSVPGNSVLSPDNIPVLPLSISNPESTGTSSSAVFQAAGSIALTRGQASELFRMYFSRCHQYLPFRMANSTPDYIYSKSHCLFWVICAVNASWTLRSRLQPVVKSLVADTISALSQTVETVQALIILSMWPFPVSSLNEDPSYYYSGLAWQMSLQLGLHRPLETHSHQYGSEEDSRTELEDVKLSTWLACFVLNNLQSTYRGVPPIAVVDLHLLNAFESPSIDGNLSRLCRITHLLMQSTLAISANNPTPSGMLEPEARLKMIQYYEEQFATLQTHHLSQMDDIIKIVFLSSRLQLWSFALLQDVPPSPELQDCVEKATADAIDLIEICYGKNLSVAPYHVRRSMCFSAFTFIRVLLSPQVVEPEVLEDRIERVCQLLEINSSSSMDLIRKACQIIRMLPKMKDRKIRPPILSRMGASIVYDSLRIYVENEFYSSSTDDDPGAGVDSLDLDGFDWQALGPLL